MFVKIRSLGIAGFLDMAVLPLKSLLGKDRHSGSSGGDCKVALVKGTTDSLLNEEPVLNGSADVCETKAIRMILAGERIVVEGFPLERLAELCFKHNYRWRFHNGSKTSPRFLLEPGKSPLPPTKDSPQ